MMMALFSLFIFPFFSFSLFIFPFLRGKGRCFLWIMRNFAGESEK